MSYWPTKQLKMQLSQPVETSSNWQILVSKFPSPLGEAANRTCFATLLDDVLIAVKREYMNKKGWGLLWSQILRGRIQLSEVYVLTWEAADSGSIMPISVFVLAATFSTRTRSKSGSNLRAMMLEPPRAKNFGGREHQLQQMKFPEAKFESTS